MTSQFLVSGIDRYGQAIQAVQTEVIQTRRDLLQRVAQAMADTIRRGRRIVAFGTGHSHLLAEVR